MMFTLLVLQFGREARFPACQHQFLNCLLDCVRHFLLKKYYLQRINFFLFLGNCHLRPQPSSWP